MGKIKDEQTSSVNEDVQDHKLTDSEAGLLRMMNLALQFNTQGQRIISAFLYYICVQRLGYKEKTNLSFKFDFDNQDNILTVTLLPEDFTPQQ